MPLSSIPVLCYHNLNVADGHTPEQLAAHLDYFQSLGFKTLTAQGVVDIVTGKDRLKAPAIALTFDDAHLSNWLHALPLLASRGMRATFFACSELIAPDGPVRDPATAPRLLSGPQSFYRALIQGDKTQFCNQAELRSLVQDYGMQVLPHSAAHAFCFQDTKPRPKGKDIHWGCHQAYGRDISGQGLPCPYGGSAYAQNGWWPLATKEGIGWVQRSDEQRYRFCLRDFARCKGQLEAILGHELDIFCWPWGEYDRLAETALVEVGYRAAFTLERGRVGPGTNPLRIGRLAVSPRKSLIWLRQKIALLRFGPIARLTHKNGALDNR